MFTIEVMEGAEFEVGPFQVGEADDMLEAQFVARDEIIENPAAAVAYVRKGDDIVYVIEALGQRRSGFVAMRDGSRITTLNEALELLK